MNINAFDVTQHCTIFWSNRLEHIESAGLTFGQRLDAAFLRRPRQSRIIWEFAKVMSSRWGAASLPLSSTWLCARHQNMTAGCFSVHSANALFRKMLINPDFYKLHPHFASFCSSPCLKSHFRPCCLHCRNHGASCYLMHRITIPSRKDVRS